MWKSFFKQLLISSEVVFCHCNNLQKRYVLALLTNPVPTFLPPSTFGDTACIALALSPHLFVASYQVLLNPADGKEHPKLYWVCVAKFWWWEDTGVTSVGSCQKLTQNGQKFSVLMAEHQLYI